MSSSCDVMPTAYRETGGEVLSQQSDNTSLNKKRKTDNELLCFGLPCLANRSSRLLSNILSHRNIGIKEPNKLTNQSVLV